MYRTVGGFILMLLGIHMYSAWMHTHPDEAINFIGLVGVFITVGMFASPLAQLVCRYFSDDECFAMIYIVFEQ